jgi:DNA-binding NarL/FixJ family response regulator
MMKVPNLIPVENPLTFRQRLIFLKNIENSSEEIEEASNGEEIVRLLTNRQTDLIVMNLKMPQSNGIEIIQKAMKMLPDLKILASTEFGDDEYIVSLIKTGSKGILSESNSISEIEKDIHSYLTTENYCMNNKVINIINKTSVNKLQIPNANKRITGKAMKLYTQFNLDVQ